MGVSSNTFQLKLDHVLVATDFSDASRGAVLYATSIARRNQSKLFVAHVVTSGSASALMDGWRAGQTVITDNLIANRLDGIESELIVRQGEIWPVLAQLVAEREVDLLVLGTRGRTGIRKLILGSVAETIFREASCPVLTVGPGVTTREPEGPPQRILAATGFAPHSIFAVKYATALAQHLSASLAVINVATGNDFSGTKEAVRNEHLARLRDVIPPGHSLASKASLFVEFGSVPERILGIAGEWNADLIVLGLHHVDEASKREMTWAKAYEIVRQAKCPVLTVRRPP
jgi:nucleotide-binding universal stress UspA family protein